MLGTQKFFFSGYDGPGMAEVFVSDGTEEGTHLIQEQWTQVSISLLMGGGNSSLLDREIYMLSLPSGNHPDRLVYSGFWAHPGDVTGEEPYLH